MKSSRIVFSAVLALSVVGLAVAGGSWTQWGGPNRNFVADSSGLAAEWPEDGPPKLWTRDLGDGYSGILVEDALAGAAALGAARERDHAVGAVFVAAFDDRQKCFIRVVAAGERRFEGVFGVETQAGDALLAGFDAVE